MGIPRPGERQLCPCAFSASWFSLSQLFSNPLYQSSPGTVRVEDSPAAMLIAVHFNPDHNIITAIAIYRCPAGIKAPELGARCMQETVGAVRSYC